MGNIRFDWRWIAVIVVLVMLANARSALWPVAALIVAGAGVYVLSMGWKVWMRDGGAPSRSRVTYWRGQRYEVAPQRRGPALPRMSDIGPAILYFIIGVVLVLVGIAIAMRGLGM